MQDQNDGDRPDPIESPDPEPVAPEEDEPKRPTPVRMAMEGEEEEKEGPEKVRIIHDETSGLDWMVTVSGRSASGILPLRTVPLMELTFSEAENPDRFLRRAVCYGGALADIPDDELLSSFKSSEPFREPMREPREKGSPGRLGNRRKTPRD